MENKDQLNQIPVDPEMGLQDEKTSQTQNNDVEASPKTEEIQEPTSEPVAESTEVEQAELKETEAPAIDPVTETIDVVEEVHEPASESEPPQQENDPPAVEAQVAESEEVVPEIESQPESDEEAPVAESEILQEEAEPEQMVEEELTEESPELEAIMPEVDDAKEIEAKAPEAKEIDAEVPETKEIEVETPEAKEIEPELPEGKEIEDELPEGKEIEVEAPEAKEIEDELPEGKEIEVEVAEEAVVTADTGDELESGAEHDEDEDEAEHEEHSEGALHNVEEMSREELIESIETLVNEDDVTKIKSRIALIKVAFLRKTKQFKETSYQSFLEEGGEKESYAPESDELDEKFNKLFDVYRQKRAVYLDNLETEKIENLKKKQAILDALKELIGSEETLKKTYDDFRDLQDSWRTIGMVPKTEVNNLWQSYHFLVEKFFDKVKINKELKDLDLKKNLEQKIELCEKVEELLLETSIIKSFKQLQRYHELWKEIGPVPDDKKDEIWDRFKSTTDKINQRRRDHYKLLQEEQESNLAAKVALCEKSESLLAEEVTSIKGWQLRTRQFNDLFKVWKTIGQAPKKQNDEVWERFKASLDGFFTEKKEYFSKIKEQQVNNYNFKVELCMQAEALKDSDDWRNTTRDLIDMQKQWKEIGPVPRKYADKIWQRFREACDEFFNKKSTHFSSIRSEETDNLKKKEDLIAAVENHEFGADKSKNLELLKDYQRQWTEIGFVPFKDKDRLQNAFRNAINKRLDQLNISNSEMSLSSYISKMDVMKNTSDGNRQLQREQIFVQNKITQLREDIMLWENNIGFLADTKNANIFKVEFEKKIEKAKSELSVLESKLKILSK